MRRVVLNHEWLMGETDVGRVVATVCPQLPIEKRPVGSDQQFERSCSV